VCFDCGVSEQDAVDIVKAFLRGQNLEQLGRTEEAIQLYELAVEGLFDSTGPYDRLIHLYSNQALHGEVVRVAEAAIRNVHTYADKKAWYEQMRAAALKARAAVPPAVPKNPR
jgi:hypothetical protein